MTTKYDDLTEEQKMHYAAQAVMVAPTDSDLPCLDEKTLTYARARFQSIHNGRRVAQINRILQARLLQRMEDASLLERTMLCEHCGLPRESVNPEQGEARCICD